MAELLDRQPAKRRVLAVRSAGRLAVLLTSFLALASTLVYVHDVRQRYNNKAPVPWAALSGELSRWHGDAEPSDTATQATIYLRRGVSLAPVNLDGSTSLFPRTAAKHFPRFSLYNVDCEWAQAAGRHRQRAGDTAPELHAFFIHGNSGGASQGHVWNCGLSLQSRMLDGDLSHRAHTYTFSFGEQANVHRGRLLEMQADYVADAVEAVLCSSGNCEDVRANHSGAPDRQVWLIGHSMGGIVARTAAALLFAGGTVRVDGVLTFNTPHRYPPVLMDRPARNLYMALNAAAHSSAEDERVPRNFDQRHRAEASSSSFIKACTSGGRDGGGAACRHFGAPGLLLSLTSGEMDVQIEPATTYPFIGAATNGATASLFVNLQSESVCGHSASHDGAIRDACMVAFGAAAMLNATGCPSETRCPRLPPAAITARGPAVPSAVQVLLPDTPFFGLLGRQLWQWHLWPLSAATLTVSLLLTPLVRHAQVVGGRMGTVETMGPEAAAAVPLTIPAMVHRPTTRPRGRSPLLRLARQLDTPSLAAFTLLLCVNIIAVVGVALGSWTSLGTSPWTSSAFRPWVWDRWLPPSSSHPSNFSGVVTAHSELAAGGRVFHSLHVLLLSCVAACVGIVAAEGICALLEAAQFLSGHVLAALRRRLGRGGGGHSAVQPGAMSCRQNATLSVLVSALYVTSAVLLPLSLTWRAILWLSCAIVASAPPPCRTNHRKLEDEVDGNSIPSKGRSDGQGAVTEATALFALLHLLQLQPEFTIRNELVSMTSDTVQTVDWLVYLTELCVVAQLTPALGYAIAWLKTALQKTRSKPRTCVVFFMEVAAYTFTVWGCLSLAAIPVELSTLPVALLLSLPSFFLLRPLGVPA